MGIGLDVGAGFQLVGKKYVLKAAVQYRAEYCNI